MMISQLLPSQKSEDTVYTCKFAIGGKLGIVKKIKQPNTKWNAKTKPFDVDRFMCYVFGLPFKGFQIFNFTTKASRKF